VAVSICEGKAAYPDEDAAQRTIARHGLGHRYTPYYCEVCRLWHYGLQRRGSGSKQRRKQAARAAARASQSRMAQALREAGWLDGGTIT
jgi:hypothetical protein